MAGLVPAANLGGVVDPRLGDEADFIGTRRDSTVKQVVVPPPEASNGRQNIFMDPTISFEAYNFWAQRAREEEKHFHADGIFKQAAKIVTGKKINGDNHPHGSGDVAAALASETEKKTAGDIPVSEAVNPTAEDRWGIQPTEWELANRATRNATWVTIFYLITTDILGPYNVPWAIAQMGYGPGITLYVVFGATAFYSGLQLWKQFCGLDSPRYPMRGYGDLGFRIFGGWARHIINILQSFQFFLNVTLLIVGSGQGLQQMAAGSSGNGVLCFVAAEVIFMGIGFVLGQIRTLQRLGFLANVSVWLNVFVIFMTMGVVPSYGPNIKAAAASYNLDPNLPVMTAAYWPQGTTLIDHINGLMNGVFAYGGATLFNELMAEMRRPMDFWKGFVLAEIFIFSVYITMGLVVYSYQGQYSFNPAYQGIPNSAYAWQTVGNAISLVSGMIAAVLYGNIGVKVLYSAVFRDVFGFPPLETKVGKLTWIIFVPIYWALAFIIGAAIPQISNLISFVGAAFILQFSYTFPPILMVAYNIQKDAMLPEEEFNPVTGEVRRVDNGMKRWVRGFMKKPFRNSFDSIYFVCALATAGLGIYASVIGMNQAFQAGTLTPFTCNSPTG